jgi:putative SbcD/Mre11-related phosphoesterase
LPLRLVPNEPALLMEGDDPILVVSDLHLGYERALEARGVHVPEQTRVLADRVKSIAHENGAKRLVILGDVKHDVKGSSLYTSLAIASFFREMEEFKEVYVIPGNHDGGLSPLLPPSVRVSGPGGLALELSDGRAGFFHGHAYPSAAVSKAKVLVCGHQHLILAREGKRQGIWVRLAFGPPPRERTLIVMPAFNSLLSGVPAADFTPKRWMPVLSSFLEGRHRAEVFLLDGSKLGSLDGLAGRLQVETD